MPNALNELTATAATDAMRRGDIKAEDYARALLNQVRRLEALNAFRTIDGRKVLEAARTCDLARAAGKDCGRLHGLPIPVKDSVDTAGLPTSNGTRSLRDFRPTQDAAVLKPLFEQGAILMGKTNLHELSRGWTSNNGAFGAVRNPYNPGHVPGGSSGGSGVAVAARMAPLAVAEDTLGSIRVPASLCGIAGLRPTFGRYPGTGVMALTLDKFDQVGPLARSVADIALFDSVVTGDFLPIAARDLKHVRLGISRNYFLTGLDAQVERMTFEALERIRAAGATLAEVEPPDIVRQGLSIATTIIGYENIASISQYLQEQDTRLGFEQLLAQASPNIQSIYRMSSPPARAAYEAALQQRAQLRAAIQQYFDENAIDALVFPSTLAAAPTLGDNLEFDIGGERVSIRQVMGRNTALGSVASLAGLVLPAGLTAGGLPVGLEFVAAAGRDRALLSMGISLEAALGPMPPPRLAGLG